MQRLRVNRFHKKGGLTCFVLNACTDNRPFICSRRVHRRDFQSGWCYKTWICFQWGFERAQAILPISAVFRRLPACYRWDVPTAIARKGRQQNCSQNKYDEYNKYGSQRALPAATGCGCVTIPLAWCHTSKTRHAQGGQRWCGDKAARY